MLTCKEFLHAMNEYLDETEDAELRREVEEHIRDCPNCWVVFDTTKRTLRIFRNFQIEDFPEELHERLMRRLEQRLRQRRRRSQPDASVPPA